MNIEIKKTVKAGNSSAVILPKAWLDQEVRVELVKKTPEKILYEALGTASNHVKLEEIIGVYLTGSHARGEESAESDIDVLIITTNTDKETIHEGIYNILIVSEELLKWKLKNYLLPVGQMLKEAKPLLNSPYLESIKVRATKKNVKWYVETTKDKLDIIKKALKNTTGRVNNRVAYSLVLRIRTLQIIQDLIVGRNYSKKELIKTIDAVSGSNNAYEAYIYVKNNVEEKPITKKEEAEKLCNYLEDKLMKVIKLLK